MSSNTFNQRDYIWHIYIFSPLLVHTCATCSELPSNISTMIAWLLGESECIIKTYLIQLHGKIGRLEVQGHQLATRVPENLNKEVSTVPVVVSTLNTAPKTKKIDYRKLYLCEYLRENSKMEKKIQNTCSYIIDQVNNWNKYKLYFS